MNLPKDMVKSTLCIILCCRRYLTREEFRFATGVVVRKAEMLEFLWRDDLDRTFESDEEVARWWLALCRRADSIGVA